MDKFKVVKLISVFYLFAIYTAALTGLLLLAVLIHNNALMFVQRPAHTAIIIGYAFGLALSFAGLIATGTMLYNFTQKKTNQPRIVVMLLIVVALSEVCALCFSVVYAYTIFNILTLVSKLIQMIDIELLLADHVQELLDNLYAFYSAIIGPELRSLVGVMQSKLPGMDELMQAMVRPEVLAVLPAVYVVLKTHAVCAVVALNFFFAASFYLMLREFRHLTTLQNKPIFTWVRLKPLRCTNVAKDDKRVFSSKT